MKAKAPIKNGDILEVLHLELHGAVSHPKWVAAQVVAIADNAITVRFVKDSTKLMDLHRGSFGRTWRR